MSNNEARYWLDEMNVGTIRGAINSNPTAAVRFFGSLAVLSDDTSRLRIIAGAAWRMTASDDQLADYQKIEAEMFGQQTFDEMRAEAERVYSDNV